MLPGEAFSVLHMVFSQSGTGAGNAAVFVGISQPCNLNVNAKCLSWLSLARLLSLSPFTLDDDENGPFSGQGMAQEKMLKNYITSPEVYFLSELLLF